MIIFYCIIIGFISTCAACTVVYTVIIIIDCIMCVS